MEEINWNLASNTQIKEELERLQTLFTEKQNQMKEIVSNIDKLNGEMTELSKSYVEIKGILNKREGKNSV